MKPGDGSTAQLNSGAFVPGELINVSPTNSGILDGNKFAVKDLIDIKGYSTGGGNPMWRAANPLAEKHASVVSDLLSSGAECVGKTITDELAFSLEGRNVHYGTPTNPRNNNWLPGGSSSGSAVAVSAGLVDFALGTDTGGSVRVPAAFCGVYGFRPSHGAISLDGVTPFSPSYDTIGWFARDASLLRDIGRVLLPKLIETPIESIFFAPECFEQIDPAIAGNFLHSIRRSANLIPLELFAHFTLEEAQLTYSTIQGYEIKTALESLIRIICPNFAEDIAARFEEAFCISKSQYEEAMKMRTVIEKKISAIIPLGSALLLPTVSLPYLEKDASGDTISTFYAKTLGLNSIAGHSGSPQVQMGLGTAGGGPGLSFVGTPGSDMALLDFAVNLSEIG